MAQTTTTGRTGALERPAAAAGGLGDWLREDTLRGIARRRAVLGYLFLLPTVIGILVFTAGPVVVSLGLSLFRWNVITPPEFVGFQNYTRLVNDATAWTSFVNTVRFVGIAVTIQLVLALLLAIAVGQKMPRALRYFFRTAYFLPLLTSAASISIVLTYLFHRDFGVINYYLGLLGSPRIPWLTSSAWSMWSVIIAYVWHGLGFMFIVFVGGLTNLPRDVLDAADVDGAVGWQRLRHITLPLLSPTILFAAVIGVINALQVFAEPYVMTRGGPGDSSRTVVMTIYEAAFKNLELGYGSAMAMVLFVLILLVTAFQFWVGKRSVFYQ